MTFLIVIMAALMLLMMMVMNLGQLAQLKTKLSNAVDQAALGYASALGNIARQVAIDNGSKVNRVCKFQWSVVGKIFVGIAAAVLTAWAGGLGGWAILAAVVVGGVAAGGILLDRLVVIPNVLANITERLKRLAPIDQMRESAIVSVLVRAVDDPNTEPDEFKLTCDPQSGQACTGAERVPAFANWYTRRLNGLESKRLGTPLEDVIGEMAILLRRDVARMERLKTFLDVYLPRALKWISDYPLQQPQCDPGYIGDLRCFPDISPDFCLRENERPKEIPKEMITRAMFLAKSEDSAPPLKVPGSSQCLWIDRETPDDKKVETCAQTQTLPLPTTFGKLIEDISDLGLGTDAQGHPITNGGLPFWADGIQYPGCGGLATKPVLLDRLPDVIGEVAEVRPVVEVRPPDKDPLEHPTTYCPPDAEDCDLEGGEIEVDDSGKDDPFLARCDSAPPPKDTNKCGLYSDPDLNNPQFCDAAMLIARGADDRVDEVEAISCQVSQYMSFVDSFLNASPTCEAADAFWNTTRHASDCPSADVCKNTSSDAVKEDCRICNSCLNARLGILSSWLDLYESFWSPLVEVLGQQLGGGFYGTLDEGGLSGQIWWLGSLYGHGYPGLLDFARMWAVTSPTPQQQLQLKVPVPLPDDCLTNEEAAPECQTGLPYYQDANGNNPNDGKGHAPAGFVCAVGDDNDQQYCLKQHLYLFPISAAFPYTVVDYDDDYRGELAYGGVLKDRSLLYPLFRTFAYLRFNLQFFGTVLYSDRFEYPRSKPDTVALSTDHPLYGWLDPQGGLHLVEVDAFTDSSNANSSNDVPRYQTTVHLPYIRFFTKSFFDNCREVRHATGTTIVTVRRYDQDQPVSRFWTFKTRPNPEVALSDLPADIPARCVASDGALKGCLDDEHDRRPFRRLLNDQGVQACAKAGWSWRNVPDVVPDYGSKVKGSQQEKSINGIGLIDTNCYGEGAKNYDSSNICRGESGKNCVKDP